MREWPSPSARWWCQVGGPPTPTLNAKNLWSIKRAMARAGKAGTAWRQRAWKTLKKSVLWVQVGPLHFNLPPPWRMGVNQALEGGLTSQGRGVCGTQQWEALCAERPDGQCWMKRLFKCREGLCRASHPGPCPVCSLQHFIFSHAAGPAYRIWLLAGSQSRRFVRAVILFGGPIRSVPSWAVGQISRKYPPVHQWPVKSNYLQKPECTTRDNRWTNQIIVFYI